MKINSECCYGCKIGKPDQIEDNCSVRDNEGISVSKVTAEHLVVGDYRDTVNGDQYKICMNEDCDVIYYSSDNKIRLLKDQIRVPIWSKRGTDPKYTCCCNEVTESQIVEAVVRHDAKSAKEVNVITGAVRGSNCREGDPLGVCCHKIIQEAISKGLKMKQLQSICFYKREPIFDVFPPTSMDIFPITTGVETVVLMSKK